MINGWRIPKNILAVSLAALLLAGCSLGGAKPASQSSPPGAVTPGGSGTPGSTLAVPQPAAPASASGEPAASATPASAAGASASPSSKPGASAAASPPADSPAPAAPASPASPRPTGGYIADHVVIVVEENHSYKQIVGSPDAPYMQTLISRGALFTDAHGITHPSQGNYIALFSGSTQGVKDDSCGKPFAAANFGSELLNAGLSFAGYSEDLPGAGYTGCSFKGYARKHNPWVQFTNVPAGLNKPLTEFPQDYAKLPTVSFVIPNHQNDMHDGTVKQADDWLKKNMDAYAAWAETHNSLLIVTWDEDDFGKENHIPVILAGPMVKPGKYGQTINHYHVLKLLEEMYKLPLLGESAKVPSIASIWK